MAESTEYSDLRAAMFLRAALLDSFRPRDVLSDVLPHTETDDILLRGQLMSALREHCTRVGDYWQLRPIVRRSILAEARAQDGLPDSEIGAALRGESLYSDVAISDLLSQDASLDKLSVAVSTLEQAGPAAPGHAKLLALTSKLDRARGAQSTDTILSGGFVGRREELDALLAALDQPQRTAPLRTVHIQGLPGVGKTYLLEQLSKLCRSRPRVVLIRLDFDRSALSNGGQEALLNEVSRQISTAMPHVATKLNALRQQVVQRGAQAAKGGRNTVAYELVKGMLDILSGTDCHLVFLLDTLEVVQARGATFSDHVLEHIDPFAATGGIDITVISAGRGVIFGPEHKRLNQLLLLEKLDRDVAAVLLARRDVPAALHDQIITLARGNPLRLELVTRALQGGQDAQALSPEEVRAADNGYLYRVILSRVPPAARQIAAEGLILPALGQEELVHILAPALGLTLDIQGAAALIETLREQRWMLGQNSAGKLVQLPHVRREMLEVTYSERAVECRAVNETAAAHYETRDPVMHLYHRLQLLRAGVPLPRIDPVVAQQVTQGLLADLPPTARDAVLRAQGARSRVEDAPASPATARPMSLVTSAVRQKRAISVPRRVLCMTVQPGNGGTRLRLFKGRRNAPQADPGGLADLRNMLILGERREASHLVRRVFAKPVSFEGDAAMLAFIHQWYTGHWSMAEALFDLLPRKALRAAVEQDLSFSGLALIEAGAEFHFDRLVALLRDSDIAGAVTSSFGLTSGSGLRGAALSRAMLAATDQQFIVQDIGMSILCPYLPQRHFGMARDIAVPAEAMRGAFGLRFAMPDDKAISDLPDIYAQRIAPLNPYITPFLALLEDLSDGAARKMHRDIHALGTRLPELGAHLAPFVQGVDGIDTGLRPQARDVAEVLGAIGLTAELLGAYSYFSPVPDLPTIARAAARWQDATLGRWTHSNAPPKDWQGIALDPLALARTDAILNGENPQATALSLLRMWDDPAQGTQTRTPLPAKLGRAFGALPSPSSVPATIAHLQTTTVPSALWAPLAALSQLGLRDLSDF